MLDIIGNIKIDESKPERVEYFLACLRSWAFFRNSCAVLLNIEAASDNLQRKVKRVFEEYAFSGEVTCASSDQYGKQYCDLLSKGKNSSVINFIEDQFAIINDPQKMLGLLQEMQASGVDIVKTSFWKVEQNSKNTLKGVTTSFYGKIFRMTAENHAEYGRHYGPRFMIGVNFLTTRDFALKFWNRNMGHRPHEYEIGSYNPDWEHTCMIPSFELLVAIDDDHGEEGTCLLKRKEEKWNKIFHEANAGTPPELKKKDEPILQNHPLNFLLKTPKEILKKYWRNYYKNISEEELESFFHENEATNATIMAMEEYAQVSKNYREAAKFGYIAGFKNAIESLSASLPMVEKKLEEAL